MKNKILIIVLITVMLIFGAVGYAYAQEDPGDLLDPDQSLENGNEDPIDDPDEEDLVCEGMREHPVILGLAERYQVEYDELLGYFCDLEMGIGEIAHALRTVQVMDGSLTMEELLEQRIDQEMGWGEIWQELGLIGNGRNWGNDIDEDENGEGESEDLTLKGFANRPGRNFSQWKNSLDEGEQTPGNNSGTLPGQSEDFCPPGLSGNKNPNKPDNPGRGKGPKN